MYKFTDKDRQKAKSTNQRNAANGGRTGSERAVIKDVRQILSELGYDTTEELYKVATNQLICRHCQGDGIVMEQKYLILRGNASVDALKESKDSMAMYPCPRCVGTGCEDIPTNIRTDAIKTLASMVTPKLSAVAVQVERADRPMVRRLHAITDEVELDKQKKRMKVIENANLERTGNAASGIGSENIEEADFSEVEVVQELEPGEEPKPVVRRSRPPQPKVVTKKTAKRKPTKQLWKS